MIPFFTLYKTGNFYILNNLPVSITIENSTVYQREHKLRLWSQIKHFHFACLELSAFCSYDFHPHELFLRDFYSLLKKYRQLKLPYFLEFSQLVLWIWDKCPQCIATTYRIWFILKFSYIKMFIFLVICLFSVVSKNKLS